MPVLSMSEVAWDGSQAMLSNGPEMSGSRQTVTQPQQHPQQQHPHPHQHQIHGGAVRSQDDATVGYFFQRPQNETMQQYNSKRWAVGDDSAIEQVRSMNELERDFHSLGFNEREQYGPHSKKLWEDEKAGGDQKLFHANSLWTAPREDGWGGNPPGQPHVVSNPISMVHRRPGSFPGSNPGNVLSPQSSETSALGVNMVEYVLGGSPTGKDMETRLARMKVYGGAGDGEGGKVPAVEQNVKAPSPYEGGDTAQSEVETQDNMQTNGIMQNGLEVDKDFRPTGSRHESPTEDNPAPQNPLGDPKLAQPNPEDFLEGTQAPLPQNPGLVEASQFEPVGLDPQLFPDYPSQLMQQMDSPNFAMDYNQQLMQRQQQPIALLAQQQYALAQQQQQLGLAPTAFAPSPYVLNAQDPYAVGIPMAGPAVVPQYYGVQTPWGIYPAGIVQQPGGQQALQAMTPQQQQQLMRGQTGRPLTPSQQSAESLGTPTGGMQGQPGAMQAPGYQILAPAYYDQNGQLVMSNPRGLGTPVRLVSPAPVLMNAAGQANGLGNNALRLLTTQQQQGQATPVPYSGSSTPNAALDNNSSMAYTQSSNLFTPISSNLGLTPPQAGFGTSAGERHDSVGSLDYRDRQLPQLNHFYGPLGTAAASPAGPMGLVQPGQSLTPPPSLSGSNSNLSLAALGGGGRLYNAAPGAEAKFRNGTLGGSLLSGSLLAASRSIPFNRASLSKEVTGRSRLLEDFRNNRIPNLQLKDLVNHVVEFSQDQHGSRFIQQKLERANPAEKAMVFNEILSSAYSLMTDVFGNYVIQKFFEFGTQEQKQTLAQRVRGQVLPLALQMYGCRVIQKALESIPADMQVEIVKELDGHVLKCVKDQNGNHVVQKCIECVDAQNLQFIIDAFKGQVFTLSSHPYGCRVIQRILEHCNLDQTGPILEELHQQTERLVQDQYGNYVIQHVLEHGRPEDKSKIVAGLRGKVLLLSQHKFASNVVEKCVTYSSKPERAMLIDEVCSINDGALFSMMKDQFANYVVQKMMDVAEPAQRKMLIYKVRPHVAALRKFTYGKHILAKLEKYYMKNNIDPGPIGMPPNGALP